MNELRACRENNELEVHAHIVASGPPGYSPTIDVEETETGVEVTVNDLEGEHKTEIFIPKKVSDLENDEHFIKDEELAEWTKQPEKPEYTPEEVGADPEGSAQEVMDALDEHKEDKENPHAVTAEQVGADPEGSADAVQQDLDTHKNNRQNPHGVTPEQIGALPISTKIPTKLSDLTSDTTHRLVTDAEKTAWNGKYRKPDTGIPISDLDPSVANSLNKADSAVQTETDPTVPSWAKQSEKPSYTYDEVGADKAGSAEAVQQNLTVHANNKNNPHNVTIQQIGAMSAATKIPTALADLSSDTAHRTVTDAEKNAWNSKYKIPTGGIPKSEFESAVQSSLSRADIALVASDLADYYNKEEVNVLVSAIPKFAIEVVDSLPTTNISNTTVYLLKENDATGNLYTEYIYVNNAWEVLGSQRIDLTGYATEEFVYDVRDDLGNRIIVFSDTEPTYPYTKEWIDETVQTLQIPDITDFNQFKSEVDEKLKLDSTTLENRLKEVFNNG